MTTHESLVVTLDLARKLKEAGWPQTESFFRWFHRDYLAGDGERTVKDYVWVESRSYPNDELIAAAPTAEEILRRLPQSIEIGRRSGRLEMAPMWDKGYRVCYVSDTWLATSPVQYEVTLTNALASMWLYLKEHDLLPSQP